MLHQERDSGHLSTTLKLAENKPLQLLESPIYNSHQLVEFTGNLQTNEGLQRAGWDSFAEIKRFIGDINLGLIKGLTLEQAVAFSARILIDHIRFHDAEFTRQEPFLPHHNNFGLWKNDKGQYQKRWLGNNGRPVVHGIDRRERMGAPRRAAEKTEEGFLEADKEVNEAENFVVVSVSAEGVSGYLDGNGADIPHLKTLVFADWKDINGNLKGLTFVTDLTIDQAERMMVGLGAPVNFLGKRGSEMDRVVNLLENPATFSLPAEFYDPVNFVFDRILAERGEGDIHLRQQNGPDEVWSIAQMRQKMHNLQHILDMEPAKADLLDKLTKFIVDHYQKIGDRDFQQAIVTMAEQVIQLFGGDYLVKRDHLSINYPLVLPQYTESAGKITVLLPPDCDFNPVILFLQSRSGCPSSRNSLAGKSGIAGVSIFGESDSKGSLYFPCPLCGAINKRPWEGFVNNCQSCGTDKVSCKSLGVSKKADKDENSKIIAFPTSANQSTQKAA
ncbi:hypothetical protein HYS95_03195 [Candidatus Daviesbacteria bacterium]|nr:hypothetical protein [Candidatus Daviesbacteria bacterium]